MSEINTIDNPSLTEQLKAKLSEYDFIAIVDGSGSMGEEDCPNHTSRWEFMQETATAFCRDLSKVDTDGIGLVVFTGGKVETFDGVTASKVKEIFAQRNPRGSTPMTEALQAALGMAGKSDKKDFIIVFTDGVPDNRDTLITTILGAAEGQDTDDGLTILFVQVGYEASATQFLKTLDNGLSKAKFDIVDCKTIEEAEQFNSTIELIAAAIDD